MTATKLALPPLGLSRDQWHRYTANYPDTGIVGPLVGATTPLKIQDTLIGGDLAAWGGRIAAQYVYEQAATAGPVGLMSYDLVADSLKAVSAARDIGTEVHAQIEKILLGQPVSPTERTAPYVYAFSSFLAAERPEFIHVEAMVAHLKAGYAGTFDFAARMRGRIALVDVKTGRAKLSHRLQLAGYAGAEFIGREGDPVRYPLPRFRSYYVLLLKPEGYDLVEQEITAADRKHFLYLVQAYKRIRAWENKA